MKQESAIAILFGLILGLILGTLVVWWFVPFVLSETAITTVFGDWGIVKAFFVNLAWLSLCWRGRK